MRFSIDGWSVCDARICLEVFHEADCVLDCHQAGLVHLRSWPGALPTRAPRGSGSGTGLALRAWLGFRFRRTAASRISRVPRWPRHDSWRWSRGKAPQPSRSIRIHRNARCEPRRCAAASPFSYRRLARWFGRVDNMAQDNRFDLARLEQIDRRLQVLEDAEAIRNLKARYAALCENQYNAEPPWSRGNPI